MSVNPLNALAATDEDLRAIREQIQQLKQSYEQRITQLEQRLQQAEINSKNAENTSAQAEAAAQHVSRPATSSENSFNPAISLILSGTYGQLKQDPAIPATGFAMSPNNTGFSQGFSLKESELGISANIDPQFRGVGTTPASSPAYACNWRTTIRGRDCRITSYSCNTS